MRRIVVELRPDSVRHFQLQRLSGRAARARSHTALLAFQVVEERPHHWSWAAGADTGEHSIRGEQRSAVHGVEDRACDAHGLPAEAGDVQLPYHRRQDATAAERGNSDRKDKWAACIHQACQLVVDGHSKVRSVVAERRHDLQKLGLLQESERQDELEDPHIRVRPYKGRVRILDNDSCGDANPFRDGYNDAVDMRDVD